MVQLKLEQASEVPLYVQIKNQLRLLVDRRMIQPGEQLPTVRELALSLNVNANTVSRVYADLEREGYLKRRHGVGTFVVDPQPSEAPEIPGRAHLLGTVHHLIQLGYSKRQVLELVAEVLESQGAAK
jgi:GntR family transcriptional regulator